MINHDTLSLLKYVKFFEISLESLNLFSFMTGVFFASNMMWRVKAMNWVITYLLCLVTYFYLLNKH